MLAASGLALLAPATSGKNTKQREHKGTLVRRTLGWDGDREEALAAFLGYSLSSTSPTEGLDLTAVGMDPARTEGGSTG